MSVIAPDRFVDPMGMHPRPGADRVGRSGVDGVQQRDVGTVELDQRPGEGPVQRLPLQRLGLPGPRQHGPDTGHRYDLGQSLVGHGVELGGRDVDPAIRARTPTMRRSRRAVKNWLRVGPTERV